MLRTKIDKITAHKMYKKIAGIVVILGDVAHFKIVTV